MATTSVTMTPYSNTDALFRQWCTHIHNSFYAGGAGWTQTADTGQINLATVTKAGAANTKQGYEIWKMNDSLQATAPVYVRIDYGSGSAAAYLAIWITIGTGSNGSGTITGIIFDGGSTTVATLSNNSQDTNSQVCYGSGSTNRVTFSVGNMTNFHTYCLMLGIERTKDSTGADDATGLIVCGKSAICTLPAGITGGATGGTWTMYMPFSGGIPPVCPGWQYILANINPSAYGSDIGVGVPIPMATVAKQPGTNFVVCRTSDFSLSASVTLYFYSTAHTYIREYGPAYVGNSGTMTADSTSAIMMRYQ